MEAYGIGWGQGTESHFMADLTAFKTGHSPKKNFLTHNSL